MLTYKDTERVVPAYRNPTKSEIKFGYGATHYKDMPRLLWLKADGVTFKRWTVCPIDGLRYFRSPY